jgi:geranylgeranyl reductase family protein
MEKVDCVICGAGPAGATSGKFLAEKGLSVIVLEKGKFPRDKACGGALRPSIIREFDYLKKGIERIPHTKCYRAKMYAPSFTNFVDYRPNKVVMYNIRRRDFDMLLANYAKDAGCEVRENETVTKVRKTDYGYALQTKSGKEFEGKIIIGAGGMLDPVARYLRKKEGLSEKWPKSDIGLAVMEEFEVDDGLILDRFGYERTCHFHLKPNDLYGYAWIFSKENALNIGIGAFWKDIKNIDIRSKYTEYLRSLKKQGLIPEDLHSSKPKGAPIPLRGAIKTTYSDCMMLIGDAAGFVSPVGGDGIYYAMDSGKIAANVVEDACEKGVNDKVTLSKYQSMWFERWGRDLKTLCYFADRIFDRTEQIMRYASRDRVFKEMAVALYNGEKSAHKLKPKIRFRVARDYIIYDILKRK